MRPIPVPGPACSPPLRSRAAKRTGSRPCPAGPVAGRVRRALPAAELLVQLRRGLGDRVPRVVLRDVRAGAVTVTLDFLRVGDQVLELAAQVLHVARLE